MFFCFSVVITAKPIEHRKKAQRRAVTRHFWRCLICFVKSERQLYREYGSPERGTAWETHTRCYTTVSWSVRPVGEQRQRRRALSMQGERARHVVCRRRGLSQRRRRGPRRRQRWEPENNNNGLSRYLESDVTHCRWRRGYANRDTNCVRLTDVVAPYLPSRVERPGYTLSHGPRP